VVDATSSAPTVFPPIKLKSSSSLSPPGYRALVDGGLTANNPSMLAIAEACRLYPDLCPKDVILVSLGTGHVVTSSTNFVPYEKCKSWGNMGWASYITSNFLTQASQTADYEASNVLPSENYFRFQTTYDIVMSNADIINFETQRLEMLIAKGEDLVQSRKKDLETVCDMLLSVSE
jgi:patatin-like phospholipase/acyl hydrolase